MAADKSGVSGALFKQRRLLRTMMQERCKIPGSPIPAGMANKVADWIMLMVLFRAQIRRKMGKPAFPDQETMTDDISKSAEAIEILFTVAIEEVTDKPAVLVATGSIPPLEAANDDSFRGH